MGYASKDIRNILVAGHAGCGKTTLTEALLYMSGATERMGRVEDGTTASDFDPEEIRRKASLNSSVVPVEYEGIKYNLIDAPGLFDFEAGEYEGIRAAESVLVVVSGRSGVTVGAEKAFQLARKNGKATMVFVSKCDLENANYFKILEDMKIKFGSTVCPCVVPAKLDDGTSVYINWDEYFMGIALLTAMRSKDPNSQVGACIVSSENKILSLGYNGMPIGCSDDEMPWEREGAPLDTKYMYVCHAELNAILNSAHNNLKGARVYVTLFPCNECTKAIIQSGIAEVVYYGDKYHDSDSSVAARFMFKKAGVKLTAYQSTGRKAELEL